MYVTHQWLCSFFKDRLLANEALQTMDSTFRDADFTVLWHVDACV